MISASVLICSDGFVPYFWVHKKYNRSCVNDHNYNDHSASFPSISSSSESQWVAIPSELIFKYTKNTVTTLIQKSNGVEMSHSVLRLLLPLDPAKVIHLSSFVSLSHTHSHSIFATLEH